MFISLVAAVAVHAADAASVISDPSVLGDPWATLITAITPLLIAGIKLLVPKIQTKLIPLIAGVIGLGLALAANYLAGIDVNWWQGVLLGIAGVGFRELYDQLRQKTHTVEQNENTPTAGS